MFQNIFNIFLPSTKGSIEDSSEGSIQYRKVHIQSLKDKKPKHMKPEKNHYVRILLDDELSKLKEKFDENNLYYQNSNGNINVDTYASNKFIESFMQAYYQHRGIIISPSDIWNMIMLYFSKYVDNHAEDLCRRFEKKVAKSHR